MTLRWWNPQLKLKYHHRKFLWCQQIISDGFTFNQSKIITSYRIVPVDEPSKSSLKSWIVKHTHTPSLMTITRRNTIKIVREAHDYNQTSNSNTFFFSIIESTTQPIMMLLLLKIKWNTRLTKSGRSRHSIVNHVIWFLFAFLSVTCYNAGRCHWPSSTRQTIIIIIIIAVRILHGIQSLCVGAFIVHTGINRSLCHLLHAFQKSAVSSRREKREHNWIWWLCLKSSNATKC